MSTPPRVLIIVQNLPVPFDRRVWLECRTLRDAGYDVRLGGLEVKVLKREELIARIHD